MANFRLIEYEVCYDDGFCQRIVARSVDEVLEIAGKAFGAHSYVYEIFEIDDFGNYTQVF